MFTRCVPPRPAERPSIADGAELEIDLEAGRIHDRAQGRSYQAAPMDPFARELRDAGGLMAWVAKRERLTPVKPGARN